MADLFTLDALFTLLMLVALQAVLGFDNLLYISLESKRVEPSRQQYVRQVGLAIAIALRIILLFVVTQAISLFQDSFFSWSIEGITKGQLSGHALIVLLGGGFIIYTAMKEIFHMLVVHDFEHGAPKSKSSVGQAILLIVAMNLVFSFDSILSAIALTDNFIVMAIAIVISGAMMIFMADYVADFLSKNRMYEVLGLFVLLLVGILLISEGGHLAHLSFFGYEIQPMAKSTFYFVLVVLVLVDIVQGRYQKQLLAKKAHEAELAKKAKET